MIIHAKTWWERIVGGSHVAVHMSNPTSFTKKGDFQYPTLYDPSGSYEARGEWGGRYRPSNGVFTGETESNLQDYITDHLRTDDSILLYTFDTTPEQESDLIEMAFELGDGNGFSCADHVSKLLKGFGIKSTPFPGELEKQLENLANKGIVEKTTITKVRDEQ